VTKSLEHIDKKRAALKLEQYDPDRFGASGDWRIKELEALPLEEKLAALYGTPVAAP
jgi:hypothetical protein